MRSDDSNTDMRKTRINIDMKENKKLAIRKERKKEEEEKRD